MIRRVAWVIGAAVALALMAGVASAATAPIAQAAGTQIYPAEGGGVTVKYGDGKTITLSKTATEQVQDTIDGVTVDSGETGQSYGTLAPTSPEIDVKVAEEIAKEVEKPGFAESYKQSAWNFDEALSELDSADGTLPLEADAIPYGGMLIAAGGTFYVGYKIGEQIAFVLGFGGTSTEKIEGCGCGNTYIGQIKPGEKRYVGDYYTAGGSTRVEIAAPAGSIGYYYHTGYGYGTSTEGWIQSIFDWSENCKEPSSNPEWMEPPNGAVVSPFKETNTFCERGPSEAFGNHRYETKYAAVLATYGQAQLAKASRAGIEKYGWPSRAGLSGTGLHETRETAAPKPLEHAPPKPSIVTQTSPGGPSVTPEVSPQVTTYVITKYVTDGGTGVEGTPEKTMAPELPKPRPTETGTEYKTELETDGWKKVTVRTLTEAQTDPTVGPEDVSYTVPTAGSHVEYGSEVIVEQNPATAATPGEASPGINLPSMPAVNLPNIAGVCNVFPFGVPCWLVAQFESWSVASRAPEWDWRLPFGVSWKFRGVIAEPFMEIVRPAEAILTAIGIVLLFGRFASSSSGSSDGGGGGDE